MNLLEKIGYAFDLHDLGQAYGLLCMGILAVICVFILLAMGRNA